MKLLENHPYHFIVFKSERDFKIECLGYKEYNFKFEVKITNYTDEAYIYKYHLIDCIECRFLPLDINLKISAGDSIIYQPNIISRGKGITICEANKFSWINIDIKARKDFAFTWYSDIELITSSHRIIELEKQLREQ